jgi:hypothetical protein
VSAARNRPNSASYAGPSRPGTIRCLRNEGVPRDGSVAAAAWLQNSTVRATCVDTPGG